MRPIIGIFGQMGVGKSIFARMLNKHLTNFKIKSFAQPLKETLAFMTGISVDVLNDNKDNPKFLDWATTVRKSFQHLGDVGRNINPNFWIDKCLEDYIIIDDGRFENEFDRINEIGGFTILMTRRGLERKDSHASENDLVKRIRERHEVYQEKFTQSWELNNSYSLEYLNTSAVMIGQQIEKKLRG